MLNNCLFEYVNAAIAAASDTDDASDIIDMAGFEGVMFIVPITDSVATGVATLKAQGDELNAAGGMLDLENAEAQVTCAVNDDQNGKLLIVDVYKPMFRYLRAKVLSTVANIAFGAVTAIKYQAGKRPVTQIDVAASAYVASPAQE